jgi:predicted enzyme related to lactoylglutathione lyase
MAHSVDTVFVWVSDLAMAVEWYRQMGIDAGPSYGDWQSMTVEGTTHFALHRGDRPPGASTAAVAFRVADLDAEIARLADSGITPIDGHITDTGVSRFTTFRDPDGNDIQFLERHG